MIALIVLMFANYALFVNDWIDNVIIAYAFSFLLASVESILLMMYMRLSEKYEVTPLFFGIYLLFNLIKIIFKNLKKFTINLPDTIEYYRDKNKYAKKREEREMYDIILKKEALTHVISDMEIELTNVKERNLLRVTVMSENYTEFMFLLNKGFNPNLENCAVFMHLCMKNLTTFLNSILDCKDLIINIDHIKHVINNNNIVILDKIVKHSSFNKDYINILMEDIIKFNKIECFKILNRYNNYKLNNSTEIKFCYDNNLIDIININIDNDYISINTQYIDYLFNNKLYNHIAYLLASNKLDYTRIEDYIDRCDINNTDFTDMIIEYNNCMMSNKNKINTNIDENFGNW